MLALHDLGFTSKDEWIIFDFWKVKQFQRICKNKLKFQEKILLSSQELKKKKIYHGQSYQNYFEAKIIGHYNFLIKQIKTEKFITKSKNP